MAGSVLAPEAIYPGTGILELIIRATIVYVFLVLALRLAGKHTLAQVTLTDLMIVLLIASAVKTPLTNDDKSLVAGIVTATTLIVLNALTTRLERSSKWFRHLITGQPLQLVRDGRMLHANMARECVTEEHIRAAMREHGIADISQVRSATLETSGAISMITDSGQVQHSARRHKRSSTLRTS